MASTETLRPTRVGPLGFTLPVEALANDDLWFAVPPTRTMFCGGATDWLAESGAPVIFAGGGGTAAMSIRQPMQQLSIQCLAVGIAGGGRLVAGDKRMADDAARSGCRSGGAVPRQNSRSGSTAQSHKPPPAQRCAAATAAWRNTCARSQPRPGRYRDNRHFITRKSRRSPMNPERRDLFRNPVVAVQRSRKAAESVMSGFMPVGGVFTVTQWTTSPGKPCRDEGWRQGGR